MLAYFKETLFLSFSGILGFPLTLTVVFRFLKYFNKMPSFTRNHEFKPRNNDIKIDTLALLCKVSKF